LVSIDAAGTEVKIADTTFKKSGGYLVAVKDNLPTLNVEVTAQFQAYWDSIGEPGPGFHEQFDSQHRRKERRRCWTLTVNDSMPHADLPAAESLDHHSCAD